MTALEKFEWNFLWPMFLLLILTLKTFIFRSNLNFLKVKVTQLYLILCDPMYYTVQAILQARILERVAGLFSRGSSQPMDWTQVSLLAGRFFAS